MKKSIIALALTLGSAMAFATAITPPPEAQAEMNKAQPRVEHKEKRVPLTPEQFAEKKQKHLNMLQNRKKVLDGEITCSESAKEMKDLRACFKTAMDARKELGMGHKRHREDFKKHKMPVVKSESTPSQLPATPVQEAK